MYRLLAACSRAPPHGGAVLRPESDLLDITAHGKLMRHPRNTNPDNQHDQLVTPQYLTCCRVGLP